MKRSQKRHIQLGIVMFVVILAGIWALLSLHAQTPYLASEAEIGTISSPAVIKADSTAAGGQAIVFGKSICPTLISHRGYWNGSGYTENSLNAMKAAYAIGVEWSETDVRFTKDTVPVIMHDTTVDRTTTGTGTVANMTLADFQKLKLNDGETPPTLAQFISVIKTAPFHRLMMEVKVPLNSTQTAILSPMLSGLEGQIYVNGFSTIVPTLQALKSADSKLHVSELTYDTDATTVPASMESKDSNYANVTAANVTAMHSKGYKVRAWTPDTIDLWRSMKTDGVDGIFTNKPVDYQAWIAGGCK